MARRNTLACPYCRAEGKESPVLVIRPSNRDRPRRFGGHDLNPLVVRGADVHCTVCHYESWAPTPSDWTPGDLSAPRVCSCGERYE